MADETPNPAPAEPTVEQTAPAPAPAVEQTPTVETPAAPAQEPVAVPAETSAQPELALTPAPTVLGSEPAKVEPVKGEEKSADEKKADEPKKDEAKVDDKKPEGDEAKKEDAKAEDAKPEEVKTDEPTPLPTYEWALPEGVIADEGRITAINQVFGEFEQSSKVDHAAMQALGQKMVDMHTQALKDEVGRVQKAYQDAWEKQTTDWLEAFKKDPEIGGNRQETTTEAAKQFIRTFGGNETQQAELKDLFNRTGIGNNPAVIRLLANANLVKREGKPIPAQKAAPTVVSKIARRYGSNT